MLWLAFGGTSVRLYCQFGFLSLSIIAARTPSKKSPISIERAVNLYSYCKARKISGPSSRNWRSSKIVLAIDKGAFLLTILRLFWQNSLSLVVREEINPTNVSFEKCWSICLWRAFNLLLGAGWAALAICAVFPVFSKVSIKVFQWLSGMK